VETQTGNFMATSKRPLVRVQKRTQVKRKQSKKMKDPCLRTERKQKKHTKGGGKKLMGKRGATDKGRKNYTGTQGQSGGWRSSTGDNPRKKTNDLPPLERKKGQKEWGTRVGKGNSLDAKELCWLGEAQSKRENRTSSKSAEEQENKTVGPENINGIMLQKKQGL